MKSVAIKETNGVLERIGALIGLDVDGATGTLARRAGKRHHRGQDDRGALARAGLAERRHRAITGVPTGFTEFDRKTAGLQRGDLVIVAGHPSMGKTAFAMNLKDKGKAAIMIETPRNGPIGSVDLVFLGRCARFAADTSVDDSGTSRH